MLQTTNALITPEELRHEYPLTEKMKNFLHASKETLKNILIRKDPRLVIILGPCSIHNVDSAKIYAQNVKNLSQYVKDQFFLIMRTYIEKPRSTLGWKGFLYDPFINETHDIEKGIHFARKLFLEISSMELPLAVEFVNPSTFPFFEDLITWGCVGARSVSSQIHRETASAADFPFGFKNNLDGSILEALHGILFAREPQTFLSINAKGTLSTMHSKGNPLCHLVLRGSRNKPNYHRHNIQAAQQLQSRLHIDSPIMIDCSHGNSNKIFCKQIEIFKKTFSCYKILPIFGLMLESFLLPGAQYISPLSQIMPNQSITDPCLSWKETEKLIMECYEILKAKKQA